MQNIDSSLPPGQRERNDFPRFGLGSFAEKFPPHPSRLQLAIAGKVRNPMTMDGFDPILPRHKQRSNFHCVTGWSVRNISWSGFRFADFHRDYVLPRCEPAQECCWVVFKGGDGYCSIMWLEDLLAQDVLLADRIEGVPLGIDHGAPLRLVAPAHYGYKNVKHLTAIEYWPDRRNYRFPSPYPQFMDHPRARVALQERTAIFSPGFILAFYRLLVPSGIKRSAKALRKYLAERDTQD